MNGNLNEKSIQNTLVQKVNIQTFFPKKLEDRNAKNQKFFYTRTQLLMLEIQLIFSSYLATSLLENSEQT